MSQQDQERTGGVFILGTMLFVGIVIIVFGGIQIGQKQIITGALILSIGVFDLLMIPLVRKYLL